MRVHTLSHDLNDLPPVGGFPADALFHACQVTVDFDHGGPLKAAKTFDVSLQGLKVEV
jgi:hypothetical protein